MTKTWSIAKVKKIFQYEAYLYNLYDNKEYGHKYAYVAYEWVRKLHVLSINALTLTLEQTNENSLKMTKSISKMKRTKTNINVNLKSVWI